MNRKLMMSLMTALMMATSVAPVMAQEHSVIVKKQKEDLAFTLDEVWEKAQSYIKNDERFSGYKMNKEDFKISEQGNFMVLTENIDNENNSNDFLKKRLGITGNEGIILTNSNLVSPSNGDELILNYRYVGGKYYWDCKLKNPAPYNKDWNIGGPIAFEVRVPVVTVEHKTVDGELLAKEDVLLEDAFLGVVSCALLEFHGGRTPLEVEGLEYHRFREGVVGDSTNKQIASFGGYIEFFNGSETKLIKSFESKEFQDLKPLYDKVEVDVISKPNIVFYYSNAKTVTPTIIENKGEADLVIKNVDAGGIELSSRGLNLMPGEYDVEPEAIEGYKTTSDPVKVVLKEGDKETIIFIYDKASSPVTPFVAVSAPLLVLLFVTTRKGVIIYKIEEDGTRTKIASKRLKSRLGGNVLDISKELKLANTDSLEVEFLKHTTRKVAGKEVTIKGVVDGKEINVTDTIPVQLNKEYRVRL